MNSDFPMIISMLRKERRLSQKQVAADLGISQALLSHYEKGIRECGLDFLVKPPNITMCLVIICLAEHRTEAVSRHSLSIYPMRRFRQLSRAAIWSL